MFEAAVSMFVAPAGVDICVLIVEYFFHPKKPGNNGSVAALFLIALFAASAVFGKYQFDLYDKGAVVMIINHSVRKE